MKNELIAAGVLILTLIFYGKSIWQLVYFNPTRRRHEKAMELSINRIARMWSPTAKVEHDIASLLNMDIDEYRAFQKNLQIGDTESINASGRQKAVYRLITKDFDNEKQMQSPLAKLNLLPDEFSRLLNYMEMANFKAIVNDAKLANAFTQLLSIEFVVPVSKEAPPETTFEPYVHEEINAFWETYIKKGLKIFPKYAVSVIRALLERLDNEGDCPSVVNMAYDKSGEAKNFNANEYDILAAENLRNHTLRVCTKAIELSKTENQLSLIPIMVAALAHDIGKIPAFSRGTGGYITADHPLDSVHYLNAIQEFNELPTAEDIRHAISDHHRTPRNDLGSRLRDADTAARRDEVSSFYARQISANHETKEADMEQAQQQLLLQEDVSEHKVATGPALPVLGVKSAPREKEPQSILQQQEDQEARKARLPKTVEIEWFDAEKFMLSLDNHINKLSGRVNTQYKAFSLSGVVYVQPILMYSVAIEIAPKETAFELRQNKEDKSYRNSINLAIVVALTKLGHIDDGLVKPGFPGGYFSVKKKVKGGEFEYQKAYYTPFRIEAFSLKPSEYESLKAGVLSNIVDVEIYDEKKEGS